MPIMRNVEVRVVTVDEANKLLASNELWTVNGDTLLRANEFYVTLIKLVPVELNMRPKNDSGLVVPNLGGFRG